MNRNSNMYDSLNYPLWERYYTAPYRDPNCESESEVKRYERLIRGYKYAKCEQLAVYNTLHRLRDRLCNKEHIDFYRDPYIKSDDVFKILNEMTDEAVDTMKRAEKDVSNLEKQLELAKLKEQVTALESKVKDLTPAF